MDVRGAICIVSRAPLSAPETIPKSGEKRTRGAKAPAIMHKQYYVYILTNAHNTVLYTGVTSDIVRRVAEHAQGRGSGFTSRYRVHKLVYYEITDDVQTAIAREKQIKAGSRARKVALVEGMNPMWKDLAEGLR